MQFLEKLWKMWEKMETLILSEQKEEETIWCKNQIIKLQSSSQKIWWKTIYGEKRSFVLRGYI